MMRRRVYLLTSTICCQRRPKDLWELLDTKCSKPIILMLVERYRTIQHTHQQDHPNYSHLHPSTTSQAALVVQIYPAPHHMQWRILKIRQAPTRPAVWDFESSLLMRPFCLVQREHYCENVGEWSDETWTSMHTHEFDWLTTNFGQVFQPKFL